MSLTKSNTRMLEGDIDLTTQITGVLPVANGGTGSSTPVSSGVFTESFESSEQTLPAAFVNIEVTHGLGSVPKLFQVVLRCKTAESSYSIGDEIDITSNGYYVSVYSNSTVIGLIHHNNFVYDKNSGASSASNPNNWKLVFRAFA